ncbi:hypothetical protein [Aquimarina spongiae]|uniref:Uncharacterized protein n=1 Tax=Aquimarina spongiae TaxID=570521 RepID=A0A1M6I2R5_9FLAO|nr:hypothetical protein [Aquimarina spongiae]SHJ28680.1 hypothetical protein SAMN04488508_10776 [Aquimarina spongiae]
MKIKKTYLSGKSVFFISLIVVIIAALTVYLTGINYNRSITSNLYISLSIIATALFSFMTYGLFTGIGLKDDLPNFKILETGNLIGKSGTIPDLPDIDGDDDIGAIVLSIVLWIVLTILFIILLLLLEAVFWISISIIVGMMYWIFFRALKLVFSKSLDTKGEIGISAFYALGYTTLYTGWIFGIVYLTQILK